MAEINPRAAAIADRIVPNARVAADSPSAAGTVARQWRAAYDGALTAFANTASASALDSDKLAHALLFIGWMADRYQARTARRLFGIPFNRMSRAEAVDHARATFDAMDPDEPFGDPGFSWDRGGAADLVDEDMRHWEAAE